MKRGQSTFTSLTRHRVRKTGDNGDLRAGRPAVTPKNVHGRGVWRSLAVLCRSVAPATHAASPPASGPNTITASKMSPSLERESRPALNIQLRRKSLIATEAQSPMQIIRRNGTVSRFDANKISVARTKALLAVDGHLAAASRRVHESVEHAPTWVGTGGPRPSPATRKYARLWSSRNRPCRQKPARRCRRRFRHRLRRKSPAQALRRSSP